jgi:hypothetical protein
MFAKVILGIALSVALPAWSQVDSSATGVTNTPDSELQENDLRMKKPPPVSGQAYPTEVGAVKRSNFLSGAVEFNTAYNSNVYAGGLGPAVSDMTYSIFPTIAFKRTTGRQLQSLRYSPGFTFYNNTTSLNAVNQFLDLDLEYRPSPHSTISFEDTFSQNSNPFTQPGMTGSTVSGSTQSPTSGLIAPYASTLREDARGAASYQFDRNGMIGGGGNFSLLNYPDPKQALGLYNSTSGGGWGFYNRRLTGSQYIGATYQYSIIATDPVVTPSPPGTTARTNSIFLFYTFYLNRVVSISLSAGPQHLNSVVPGLPTTNSWKPGGMVSIGGQTSRTSFAANYSYTVSAGDGFRGPFNANSANASASWQMARTWTGEVGASYSNYKNATALTYTNIPDGSTALCTASIKHPLSERFTAIVGFQYLYENYNHIPAASISPNNNRAYVSLLYTFTRPLGR